MPSKDNTHEKHDPRERFKNSLRTREKQHGFLASHTYLIGDLHNHCNISYGHGSLEKAIAFASQQLDFFSITGHFAWPDIASDQDIPISDQVAAYHMEGFRKLQNNWDLYRRKMDAAESESLIPFYSYEYHGLSNGDYTVVLRDTGMNLPPIPEAEDALMNRLRGPADEKEIMFSSSYRVHERLSGDQLGNLQRRDLSGGGDYQPPRLCREQKHTLPLPPYHGALLRTFPDNAGRARTGSPLRSHTAVPTIITPLPAAFRAAGQGSGPHRSLREGIWRALKERTTTALSGDAAQLALFVDNEPMGSVLFVQDAKPCTVDLYAASYEEIQSIELIHNFPCHPTRPSIG